MKDNKPQPEGQRIVPHVASGEVGIRSIRPTGGGIGLLSVDFSVYGEQNAASSVTILAKPKDVETFAAFRRLVCAKLGCWLTFGYADRGGRWAREAKEDWAEQIARGFQRGRAVAEQD